MKKSTLTYTGNLRIDRRTLIAVTILLGTFIGHQASSAESSIDFMCKSQAKEIAAQTYKSCVVESKKMEIERIRTEYKEKLEALKQQYSSELNSLSNKKAENEAAPATQPNKPAKPAEQEQPQIELKKKTTKSSVTSTKSASKSPAKNNKLSKKSTSKVTASKEITEELIAAPYEEEDVKRQSAEPKIKSESIDLGSNDSGYPNSGDAMELSITRVNNPEIVELPYQEE